MNKCNFMVRLVSDVDLRYTPKDSLAVATFTGAVDKRNSKKLKEEGKQSANFPRFKAFGKTAENISQYFKKGDLIIVYTTFETGMYEKQDGEKVYTNIFHVEEWEFVPNGNKQADKTNAQQSKPNDDFSFGGIEDFKQIEDDDDVPF